MKIAIVGAGLSGSHMYHLLQKDGLHDITIFEKSRGTGGRCSTRFIEDKKIDHGTPSFSTKDEILKKLSDMCLTNNYLRCEQNIYYPTQGMNKICSSLIDSTDLVTQTKIVSLKQNNAMWELKDERGKSYDSFDKVIITIPAPQVLELDLDMSASTINNLRQVNYNSIASLLIYSQSFENIMNPKLLEDLKFKKIIDNSSKYNYDNFSSYVLHLDELLTQKLDFKDKDEIKEYILKIVFDTSGIDLEEDFHTTAHYWKYATVKDSIHHDFLIDNNGSIGFIGDYYNGSNLEASINSSQKLYEQYFI